MGDHRPDRTFNQWKSQEKIPNKREIFGLEAKKATLKALLNDACDENESLRSGEVITLHVLNSFLIGSA